MSKIIGLCGFIGSGKDTVADMLINQFGYKRESFASTLKDAVAQVFGWDRDLLEGRTAEARQWRERVDTWWANRLDMPNLTPRWVLQYWGTDVCRVNFHDDIWIASLENKLVKNKDNIVISDCRFPNEITSLRKSGAKIVWIVRGELPEWYSTALEENTTDCDDQWILEDHELTMAKKFPTVHVSEWAWVGQEFDLVIENNGTLEELADKVKSLAQ